MLFDVAFFLILCVLGYTIVGCLTSCALLWVDNRRWGGDVPEWMIIFGPAMWPLIWICCVGFAIFWVATSLLFWAIFRD